MWLLFICFVSFCNIVIILRNHYLIFDCLFHMLELNYMCVYIYVLHSRYSNPSELENVLG